MGVKASTAKKPANIVLVGFMGTGKTSVGKLLAQRLNMTFVDMDEIIEKREGKIVSRIFAENGEPYFRTAERKLVQELSAQAGLVVATGGGIVLNPDNIRDFSRVSLVVCLQAEPSVILERLKTDRDRPLLEGGDKMKQIVTRLESRKKLYDAIPAQINTSGLTVEEAVDKILALWREAAS